MVSEGRSMQLTSQPNNDENHAQFPIVGIGASAGGLDAFTQLLPHLSIETGMAYVLIQHLDPQHKSLLTEILARTTKMPVSEVTDGTEIEPNHVYIIPPNTQMILVNGRLKLSPRQKTRGGYHPIDLFFQSIATECQSQSIGVVLSGADGDGSLGLSAIKAVGGITFAQDLPSSQFGGMPQHAANTGQVDFILPPPEIAIKLNEISQQSDRSALGVMTISVPPRREQVEIQIETDPLHQIFELLHLQTGVDFASYKYATIERRMQRRMSQLGLDQLQDYLNYLQDRPMEIETLYQDLLIGVTSFFRDPDAFRLLKDVILPQIVQDRSTKSPIRIWLAGCATGEEVYSVAICLLEVITDLKLQRQIQIFATDVNAISIEIARAGIYRENIIKGISPERLRRFFIAVEGGYQINKSVRDLCIFAKHNFCTDPPFSRLDLVVCRNVLIYFGSALQRKVMQTLHYGLKPNGFLMLGTSETANGFNELFTLFNPAVITDGKPFDKKCKIYTKKLISSLPNIDFTGTNNLIHPPQPDQAIEAIIPTEIDIQKIADDIVWKLHAPVGAIVNDDLEILQFRGDTSPYLRPAAGKPSFNILKMAQVKLRIALRTAIHQAKKLDLPVSKSELAEAVKFEVIPFRVPGLDERYFLILFEPMTLVDRSAPQIFTRKTKQTSLQQENSRLRQELAISQDHLQAIIDEQEATNQDIRAVNEEMLSSNEEFQSTNEELETAKEEIQAANEELSTVNEELRSRNLEASQLNNDLINILSSVQLPILIVGTDLRIGRFTPLAERIFNLIPSDVGRSFSDIRHTLNLPDLDRSILQTIETLTIYQQEIQDLAGHWYHLIVRPYKTREHQIAGATIVLVDIDRLKQSEQKLQSAHDYAAAIVETVWEPLIVLDGNLRVVTANRAFYQMFKVAAVQAEGQLLDELGNGQWHIAGLKSRLEDILAHHNHFQDFEVTHTFEQIGLKTMLLNARHISNTNDEQLILLAIEDITHRKQLEAERLQALAEAQTARSVAEAANLAKDVFLSILSHELRNPLSAMLGWSRMLRSDKLTPAQFQRGLEVIDRSATTQNQLIEDLLDISSITNGKLRLDAELIDLESVITAAIETVALAAEAKNIQIHTQLNHLSQRVLGDATRLQQILWNLLGNAIKFTDPGGEITVRLSLVNPHGQNQIAYAQIQVTDNGKGIDPEFLPRVFDRFLQADSSSTRTSAGLGLGLTIVRHLVELHGGNIIATSEVGVGSTFTISLPLSNRLPAQATSPELLPVSAESGQTNPVHPPDLHGIHVLVVDDETDIRMIIVTILEHYGATVTETDSAVAAIKTLQAHPQTYNVLISDIGMPGEDGWELIRQVRRLSPAQGGEIPAAALTAYASDKDRRMALELGFQVHIAKPIEPLRLGAIVADLARD
jgi:two-component system, chemotaxis family, CheB/CheR fusion protein